MCTKLYPGPHCAEEVNWNGTVSICLDGKLIHGVKLSSRGHVSKFFPKQQYNLKLPTEQSLLDMAPARNWILAMSFVDTSFQRNVIAFDFFRKLGGWAPMTKYVTLDWHGKDFGLYYVGEKIERGPERVRLPSADPARPPEESGYILTVDWPKPGKAYVETSNTSADFSIVYPKEPTPEQRRYISEVTNAVDALAAEAPPAAGAAAADPLERVVDFESFARYFVVQEMAMDIDGYSFSNFMAVHDGKLFHIAPWDFDLAFGYGCMPKYFKNIYTRQIPDDLAKGWMVDNIRDRSDWIGPTGLPNGAMIYFGKNRRLLFTHIWAHPAFRAVFAKMWHQARAGPLSDRALLEGIGQRSRSIRSAAEDDIRIWAKAARCAFFPCCSPAAAQSFPEAVDYLTDWLIRRVHWIDAHADDPPERASSLAGK